MRTIKKYTSLIYENANIGFVFWFLLSILLTLFFYSPFEQPILFDRAYLLHMSQVVFRGDSLYHATTFGYTPLSTILVGLFMKIGSWFSLDTIESARVCGLILYGSLCASFFMLCRSLFISKKAATLTTVMFIGMGYIMLLSSLNAEPKLWVMLCSIWGFIFFIRNQWFLIGLVLSLAAMSWHVAVVSLVAVAVVLPWKSDSFWGTFWKLAFGVLTGLVPVIIYLSATNSWVEFWNQAILRKLIVEASGAGESPLQWIREGIYPYFIPEPLHFVFGFTGFLLVVWQLMKKHVDKTLIKVSHLKFAIAYTTLWALFNSYDFQTCVDLLPLVPLIVIFAGYFLYWITRQLKGRKLVIVAIILVAYNFYDGLIYQLPFTYTEQKERIESIKEKYGDPFVIGFEEYYTILEKPMPTKFMRYAHYEDHMIEGAPGGYEAVVDSIKKGGYKVILEYDKNKRKRSPASAKLFEFFPERDKRTFTRSKCTTYLIEKLTGNSVTDSARVRVQTIPLSDVFYYDEGYNIIKLNP